MNQKQYLKFAETFFQNALEISRAKNTDYTAGSADAFANFKSVGPDWVEIGFYTRMMDKMARIKSFVSKGTLEVKDESVTDTLLDLANYCSLMAGYLQDKRYSEPHQEAPAGWHSEQELQAMMDFDRQRAEMEGIPLEHYAGNVDSTGIGYFNK